MRFDQAIATRSRQAATALCVGLDPDPARLPAGLAGERGIFEFCRAIVDATAEFAVAFKPQIAFFAAAGAEGALEQLIAHIHARHAGIPVVLDAKRGDIGSTAQMYARELFERYGADAITVNPYLGQDSVVPYTDYADRGVFVLCRTSNPGGADLQNLVVDGKPMYLHVARLVAEQWNGNGNCGLVVGATVPREIASVREVAATLPLLVPGIGAQGGDIDAAVAASGRSAPLLVSSSREILYASRGDDFAAAAAAVARTTRDAIEAASSLESS
ncbi:orotidine-5'-phosphate decarboxylase [soil metagenome]